MYVSKFEEWLYSVEGFGLRAERLAEELDGASMTGNLQNVVNSWMQAAFEVGRESMRQEAIKAADDQWVKDPRVSASDAIKAIV